MTSPASTLPPGSRAWRPRATRTPCEWLADGIPVTTCKASVLNSTPTSAARPAAGVWSSSTLSASIVARSLRRQVPDLSWIVATDEDDFDHDASRRRPHGRRSANTGTMGYDIGPEASRCGPGDAGPGRAAGQGESLPASRSGAPAGRCDDDAVAAVRSSSIRASRRSSSATCSPSSPTCPSAHPYPAELGGRIGRPYRAVAVTSLNGRPVNDP
jgi:hypothetical protein